MANLRVNINKSEERKEFYFKLKLAVLIVGIWVLIELVDNIFTLGLERFGLKPKAIEGLYGIFTFPFLHGDWNHVFSNGSSAIILLTGLFIFHEKKSFFILMTLYLGSGALLWIIGKYGSNHIGASGLIYALAFFLFVSSIREGNRNSMALSFFIILMYGSMIWGVMPYFVQENVSWEGHLAGAIVGILVAIYEYRNFEPEKKVIREEERPFFERHPLED